MALVPFAATMRFENNPAGWGGPDAYLAPPLHARAAWRCTNWRCVAWRTALNCLPRITRITLRTPCRSLQLQRSLAALAALQRFLTDITDIRYRGTARTSRVSAYAQRLAPAGARGRGLCAASV
jgi:hypothetical protein